MRLLILDRDGVINRDSPDFIKSPREWIPIPGSMQAISKANQIGFRVVVISNQSGISRGLFNINQLNKIHSTMLREVARFGGSIDAVFFCPHGPSDGCNCRKPMPGLLLDLARRIDVDWPSTFVIGDRRSDMLAADAVGAQKILVKTGHGEETIESTPDLSDTIVCDDLANAVDKLSIL